MNKTVKPTNPVVRAGYVPQEMLRPFIESGRVLTLALRLLQQIVYAS